MLRFLGSGEVCSEYLGVLADPSADRQVAEAIARWLTVVAGAGGRQDKGLGIGDWGLGIGVPDSGVCGCPSHPNPQSLIPNPFSSRWDLLELTGVDAEDSSIRQLTQALHARGSLVYQRPGSPCWRVELPETWDQYLAMLPKGRRKHLRRAERNYVDSGRAVVHFVREADLPQGIAILIDLHRRRRQSLGGPGCFASPRFAAFHREVMPRLLQNGQLHLFWVEVDGKPAAAEYVLLGNDTTYSYQAGLNPDCMNHSPGRVGHLLGLKHAFALGHWAFDFLRGNEPYKREFHARPRAMTETRIVPARLARGCGGWGGCWGVAQTLGQAGPAAIAPVGSRRSGIAAGFARRRSTRAQTPSRLFSPATCGRVSSTKHPGRKRPG